MVAVCLSLVSLYGSFLRRCVTAAGLSSQSVEIDDGTSTIRFWGPAAATSKPPLVLIHGFGPHGVWQWRPQISFFSREFSVYVPDLLFFGRSFTDSSDRSEVFQAVSIGKLMEKLGISRYSVVGTSYGGFVAYRMAEMWPERVEKVVIASSGVNMRRNEHAELLKRAKVEKIEDLMLPNAASQLRKLLGLSVFRRLYMPDFFLNDLIDKLYCENRKEKLELLKGLTLGQDDTGTICSLSQIKSFLLGRKMPTRAVVNGGFEVADGVHRGDAMGKKVVFKDVGKEREIGSLNNSCNQSISFSDESSSIGKNSDFSENSMEKSGDGEEVQSSFKDPFDGAMEALEAVLPIRRGISRSYNGKSKSFATLADASSSSSARDLAKAENGFMRRRRNLLANSLNRSSCLKSNGGGISKRVTSSSRATLALAVAFNNSDIDTQTGESSSAGSVLTKDFSSWRSFSLADLQHCVSLGKCREFVTKPC